MNKITKIISLIAALSTSAFAAEQTKSNLDSPIKASIEGGYSTEYLVYGVTYASDAPFAGFAIQAEYFGIEFGVDGVATPSSNGLNQSAWGVGLGKNFKVSQNISAHFTGEVRRYLTGTSPVPDTTFSEVGLAIENSLVTPYVKGAYGVEVDQYGVVAGLYKKFSLLSFLDVTPAFEYGYFNDYKYYLGKVGISKTFFNHLEVFAEGAYVNNLIGVPNLTFATKALTDQLIGTGGVRWHF